MGLMSNMSKEGMGLMSNMSNCGVRASRGRGGAGQELQGMQRAIGE